MRATSTRGLTPCGITPHPRPPHPRPPHPAGFVAVCWSVGCERFSSHLMLGMLLLYLNEHAGLGAAQATRLVGYCLGGTYLMALLGGLLGDRVLGPWGAGLCGTALATAGYAALVADGSGARCVGLGLVVVGSGVYKPSPQALLDRLYGPADRHRDAGFGVLYLVVNLGALGGPVVGELVRRRYGFGGVFVLGGLAMLASHLGLVMFPRHRRAARSRPECGPAPHVVPGDPARGSVPGDPAPGSVPGDPSPGALLRLCLMALLFAVAQLQTSGALLLWARDETERHLLGREIPVSYFAAAPALLILLLGPAVALGFTRLRRHGREPGTAAKLQLGMLITALAYVPLIAAALLQGSHRRVSLVWLLACLVGLALGELLVAALGPALLTQRAPPQHRARWLSAWFAAIALGCFGAGQLGGWFGQLAPAQYFALMLLLALAGAGLGRRHSPAARARL